MSRAYEQDRLDPFYFDKLRQMARMVGTSKLIAALRAIEVEMNQPEAKATRADEPPESTS